MIDLENILRNTFEKHGDFPMQTDVPIITEAMREAIKQALELAANEAIVSFPSNWQPCIDADEGVEVDKQSILTLINKVK